MLTEQREFLASAATAILLATVIAGFVLSSSTAGAQQLRTHEVGDAEEQLAMDVTPIPAGYGALFVPSLSNPEVEPFVTVLTGGDRVALGRTGERIVLPPGDYTVRVGEPGTANRAEKQVRVIDGATVPVEPFYGAIRVTAVDTTGVPVRQPFVLSQENDTLVTAATAAEQNYEDTRTWLVRPGKITLALGSQALPSTDRYDFTVNAGELLRYRVVLDKNKVVRLELADEKMDIEEKWWRLRWTVGLDGAFNQTTKRINGYNGRFLRVGVFSQGEIGIEISNHLALLRLEIDESWIGLESDRNASVPTQKLNDEASAELLYTYRLGRIIGPYVRASATTSFFPTRTFASETIELSGADDQTLQAGDSYVLIDPFAPTYFQEGAGLTLTIVDIPAFDLSFRGGPAARQARYRDGLFVADSTQSGYELVALEDTNDYGVEASAEVGLRVGAAVRIRAVGEAFVPFEQVGEQLDPMYRVTALTDLKINSFLSVVYRVGFHRPNLQAPMSTLQGVSLRVQHSLF